MTREEWIERYAKRFVTRGGFTEDQAKECAVVGYEAAAESGDLDESPEDMADEEMSYWTNDEGEQE